MNKVISHAFISVYLFLSSACSSLPPLDQQGDVNLTEIIVNSKLFTANESQIPPIEDLFTLTLSQQNIVLLAIEKKQKEGYKRHQALYEVLQDKLANFTYYGETYNAETAMRLNQGNCMSLAVLTTAYAKLLGLEFSYREVNTLPVFKKNNNLILSSSHVQTIIYDDEYITDPKQYLFRTPGLVIDYFPSKDNRVAKFLNEDVFISMYYQNLAGNALVDNDLNKAFKLANKAYQYDKSNIEAINSLAIIHRRAGDIESAEAIYLVGLKREKSNLRLLSNYIMLLKSQNRVEEAERYQQQLSKLDDPNPFHWLAEAYIAEHNKEMEKATVFYLKALKQAPYLHQAYLGLYHIYRKKGHYAKAKRMMAEALEWTYEVEQRKQYKFKLYSLAKL